MVKDTKIDDQAATIESINNDTVTVTELRKLRSSLPKTPQAQRREIDQALKNFEQRNSSLLVTDPEISGELAELRAQLDKPNSTPASPHTPPASTNTLPSEPTREPRRATAIVYDRWKEMMDPNHSTQGRLLRMAGFVAAGYGIYRLATWVTGRPKNTRTWKFLKYTGLAALAAWTLGVITHKKGEAGENASGEKPYDQAGSEPDMKEKDPNAPPSALDIFPQGENLVGKSEYTVNADGTPHKIAFKSNKILLGGVPFKLTALGTRLGNLELGISKVIAHDGTLSITAGAMFKSGVSVWNEVQLKELLGKMLKKETVITETSDGQKVEIKATN